MFSIRNLSAALSLGVILLGVGCHKKDLDPKPAMNNQPIAEDDAMKTRLWPQSTAVYENTAVTAGPDRYLYEANDPKYGYLLDTPLFLVNSVVWPFTYFDHGISDQVSNPTGASIGNGYTGIPPMTPDGSVIGSSTNYGSSTSGTTATGSSGAKTK